LSIFIYVGFAVFYALRDAKKAERKWDVDQLSKKFANLQAMAAQLSIPNEYGALLSRQGGVGLNAQTSQDETEYFVSLPANKLELWMALESGRFIAPVFRELYSEKEVVKEERRLRVENTPFGKFTEAFTETAFPDQPYGRPIIGYRILVQQRLVSFFCSIFVVPLAEPPCFCSN
jgi:predicted Zn-dependent peptidase